MQELLASIAQQVGIAITDQTSLSPREPSFLPPPDSLHPDVLALLKQRHPTGLYSHQSNAIACSLAGNDVCLATSTASGKSLVYMTAAADILKRESHARVIAFYPVRALVHDQFEKWQKLLEPLGFSVGLIDGGVPVEQRTDILLHHRVVLMTPDVAHAWFMTALNEKYVALVRQNLRLLILDEAHVYDGVFGTNMAFFLRRFQAVCSKPRLICSTATLGQPNDFIFQLTGRTPVAFGPEQEGSPIHRKHLLVAQIDKARGFDQTARLLRLLTTQLPKGNRFLAFADSRKMVNVLVAAARRAGQNNGGSTPQPDAGNPPTDDISDVLLPYRAGLESEDRLRIQQSLSGGQLRGVVSTSALEMGLDIGDVSLVVLLNTPWSMKAFWQRIGRAGRRGEGYCLFLDTSGMVGTQPHGIVDYLKRPIEPNWLYLPNRYIQYTNALCAAQERQDAGAAYDRSDFDSMPEFNAFIAEELTPTRGTPNDLFELKQRAQGSGPHREFPLRCAGEKDFKVECQQVRLGSLTYSQVLREAYPGAVYYYMARPYRIVRVNYQKGEITAAHESFYTTQAQTQIMAFPDLLSEGGVHKLFVGGGGFVAEVDMQVSERVAAFTEKRGSTKNVHSYGVGSPYSQRPLQRLIKTTGVCWFFPNAAVMGDLVGESLLAAFCNEFSIQQHDLGFGRFHVQQSPLQTGPLTGCCIYDTAHGSLRLTERLAESFARVITSAITTASADSANGQPSPLLAPLNQLAPLAGGLERQTIRGGAAVNSSETAGDWVELVASGQPAMRVSGTEAEEVVVQKYFFHPKEGVLKYRLKHENPGVDWTIEIESIRPIPGVSKTVRYNTSTGEEQPVP